MSIEQGTPFGEPSPGASVFEHDLFDLGLMVDTALDSAFGAAFDGGVGLAGWEVVGHAPVGSADATGGADGSGADGSGADGSGADGSGAGGPGDVARSGRAGPAAELGMVARRRGRMTAAFLGRVHALAHPDGQPERTGSAVEQVAAELGWSMTMAGQWLTLAEDVIDRLPVLHTVLRAGALDEIKVATVAEETRVMADDLAREVTAHVVPVAARLTKSELIDLVGSNAAALDPDWAQRRYQAARRRARVTATRTPQGTTDVAVRDLGIDHGVAVMARVDALAVAVRAGGLARGVRVGTPAIRALVSLRQQDGSCVGLDDDALVEVLVEQLPDWLAEITGPDPDGPEGPTGPGGPGHGPDDGPDDSGPDGRPGGSGPDDDPGDGSDSNGPSDGPGEGPGEGPGDGPGGAGTDDTDAGAAGTSRGPDHEPDAAEADETNETEPDHAEPDEADNPDGDRFAARRGGVRTGTSEVRLRLSTALGLDELPGQIPTWGTITATTGRHLLDTARHDRISVEWRLVLVDDHGHLEHLFLVRPGRPLGTPPPPRPARPARPRRDTPERRGRVRGRMIVELSAPTALLAALAPDDHPDWTGLIRRAQHRLATLPTDQRPGGATHPATTQLDALRRHPGRELDRWIRVRDRHCIGVMCTRAAFSADLDHTRDWIDHGPTIAPNLGAGCRHCHRLKHAHGWRLHQPTPGRFVWHTPAGARYAITPRPILDPFPDPLPHRHGRPRPVLDVDPPFDDTTPWIDHRPPRLITAAEVPDPPTPRPTTPYDDEPPF